MKCLPFQATVHRVLIASPSDVVNERKIIPEVLYEWNGLNSAKENIVLLPVKWETHSVPQMGERPQGIVNRQIVDDVTY